MPVAEFVNTYFFLTMRSLRDQHTATTMYLSVHLLIDLMLSRHHACEDVLWLFSSVKECASYYLTKLMIRAKQQA